MSAVGAVALSAASSSFGSLLLLPLPAPGMAMIGEENNVAWAHHSYIDWAAASAVGWESDYVAL